MNAALPTLDLDALDFVKGNGLVTVVAQDALSGAVLMVAHADREALDCTLRTGEMHYRSRSRGLWHKGATSGNVQRVVSLTPDCDGDAVLARVMPAGPACHEGTVSCFRDTALSADVIGALDATIVARQQAMITSAPAADSGAKSSYTQRLLADRNLRLKKLGEEAVELATACVEQNVDRATEETADLLYHALVALRAAGGTLEGVRAVLAERAGLGTSQR
ncbi:bifunctional phosphoribosyl-AMP cyclohydrolase/phosphoribosyl-ATP diphosphatase HisIE [Gemmatimonas aurantiaca]|uniref:bifunctional phosphoribosyl-AMP cyclohydrolase/phosphoribosyl-ATP diphosphatase HisIE n=1 Tax=Gemmatimonas aurantiaca TaxID=173480 RepID=UPI00301DBD36